MTGTPNLLDAIRELAKVPPNATAWLIRSRHGRYEVTAHLGVRAGAAWWMSRAAYGELLHQRDLEPADLDDPDLAARIAGAVSDYTPPALRRHPPRLRSVPPV